MIKMLAALVAAFVISTCSSGDHKMTVREGRIRMPDGVQLYYRQLGDQRSVTLIPNGMYYSDDFKHLADSRTLIFYDVRNRGRSDTVTDRSKLTAGIQHDVEDLETVRKYFKIEEVNLIGHSYIGLMIGLYAMKHPDRVNRLVQIGPAQPDTAKQYPPDLAYVDDVINEVMSDLAKVQSQKRPDDPVESCKQFWSVLGPINVFDPSHAAKLDWGRCDLPNERNFMGYWAEYLFPSIQNIHLTASDVAQMKAPVLVIHGNKDRSAAYGGARDWAMMWPNARLLTLQNVAHAPWIEAPETFFQALSDFLNGEWPDQAEIVKSLDRPS